jgi:hypothetical protein
MAVAAGRETPRQQIDPTHSSLHSACLNRSACILDGIGHRLPPHHLREPKKGEGDVGNSRLKARLAIAGYFAGALLTFIFFSLIAILLLAYGLDPSR